MATLLHHQLQQNNPRHQLLYNAPNSNSSGNLININIHPGPNHPLHQGPGAVHFCKDCGVMFESSTSLEVHLSYHKENLLTRWATNQDALDKSSNSSSGSGSHYANPSSPSPNKRDISRSDNSSVESNSSSQYYHPVEPSSHPHYLPPLYNNNTGDQHMSPGPTTPSSSSFRSAPTGPHSNTSVSSAGFMVSQQPPVEPPTTMYESFHPPNFGHGGHLQLQLGGGGHPIFSPGHNHPTSSGPPASGEHNQTVQLQQQVRDSAEILDLDSHKVHIYQHQQQQQQQSFFHRPYLPHLLPPLPPPQPGGWPNNSEQNFPSRFSPAAAGNGGGYPQLEAPFYAPVPPTTSAPPSNGGGMTPASTFEIIRMENPNYAPPSSEGSHGFPLHHQQLGSNPLVAFGGQSPYAPPPAPVSQPPPPSNVGVAKRNGKTSTGAGTPKGPRPSMDNGAKNGASPPAVKTKGWKGGECKRPKTYNCPACNKWFTSSGHLKRHYGTTLHKNSMKQLGEEKAEELFRQQPKKKGSKQANTSEPKTPKQSKKAKLSLNNNDGIGVNGGGMNIMEAEMRIKKEANPDLLYGGHDLPQQQSLPPNGVNSGHGELLQIKSYHHSPTTPPPNQFNYNIYGTLSPPPNSHSHQHHQQVHYPPPQGQYLAEFVPVPPSSSNFNGFHHQEESHAHTHPGSGPLPPFSSVGLSHYDPNFVNRVSPTYGQQQQQQQQHMTPNTSPHTHPSSVGMNGGQRENSFERENNVSPYEGGPLRLHGRGSSQGGGSDHGEGGGGSDGGGSLDGMLLEGGSSGSEDSGVPSDVGPGKAKPEVLKCPECFKTFNRSCYLKQHFKQQHSNSHSGGQLYKCVTCGKRFQDPEALAEHTAKHGADKPYKCLLCPKNFNHKTDLNRHRLLHSGDRPFSCDLCGKGFIRKDHMTKHSETHRKKSLHHQNLSISSSSSSNVSPPDPLVKIEEEPIKMESSESFY